MTRNNLPRCEIFQKAHATEDCWHVRASTAVHRSVIVRTNMKISRQSFIHTNNRHRASWQLRAAGAVSGRRVVTGRSSSGRNKDRRREGEEKGRDRSWYGLPWIASVLIDWLIDWLAGIWGFQVPVLSQVFYVCFCFLGLVETPTQEKNPNPSDKWELPCNQ